MTAPLRAHLLSLVVPLAIPLMILSPNLFGTGFSVAAQWGSGGTGVVRAYLLATLLPVAYELGQALVHRDRSFLAWYGIGTTLLSGALAFWFVDGLWYAFKTAVALFLQGTLFLGSALVGRPLIQPILVQGTLQSSPATHRPAVRQALTHPGLTRAFQQGGLLFGLSKLLFGGARMAVAYSLVTAPFGTADFNAQAGVLMAVMYLPGLLFGALAAAPAMLLLDRAVKGLYGPDASVFKAEHLARSLAPVTYTSS